MSGPQIAAACPLSLPLTLSGVDSIPKENQCFATVYLAQCLHLCYSIVSLRHTSFVPTIPHTSLDHMCNLLAMYIACMAALQRPCSYLWKIAPMDAIKWREVVDPRSWQLFITKEKLESSAMVITERT